MTTFIGIDGCRSGCIIVFLNDQTNEMSVKVQQQLSPEFYNSDIARGRLALIDIPIGLPGGRIVERTCDRMARSLLQFRKASVFPAPHRSILSVQTYTDANLAQRRLSGKGLSKQTWNITKKIREIDLLFQSGAADPKLLRESHPELCFELLYRLGNYQLPLKSKRTSLGSQQRLLILERYLPFQYFSQLERFVDSPAVGYQLDDLLDAVVLALTSQLIVTCSPTTSVSCGSNEVDDIGLPMQIFHPPQPSLRE